MLTLSSCLLCDVESTLLILDSDGDIFPKKKCEQNAAKQVADGFWPQIETLIEISSRLCSESSNAIASLPTRSGDFNEYRLGGVGDVGSRLLLLS